MSINVAREYLNQFNADGRIKEFKVSSATAPLSVSEMEEFSKFDKWVDVCKPIQTV